MANWDKVRQKNSVGPALGMAMNKAIDIVLAMSGKISTETALGAGEEWGNELREAILEWRDWIYEENEKKQQEVLESLLDEENGKELPLENKRNPPRETKRIKQNT